MTTRGGEHPESGDSHAVLPVGLAKGSERATTAVSRWVESPVVWLRVIDYLCRKKVFPCSLLMICTQQVSIWGVPHAQLWCQPSLLSAAAANTTPHLALKCKPKQLQCLLGTAGP